MRKFRIILEMISWITTRGTEIPGIVGSVSHWCKSANHMLCIFINTTQHIRGKGDKEEEKKLIVYYLKQLLHKYFVYFPMRKYWWNLQVWPFHTYLVKWISTWLFTKYFYVKNLRERKSVKNSLVCSLIIYFLLKWDSLCRIPEISCNILFGWINTMGERMDGIAWFEVIPHVAPAKMYLYCEL